MSRIPWDMLHTNTARSILEDLGLWDYMGPRPRRRELVKVLEDVEAHGLGVVTEQLLEKQRPASSQSNSREGSPELEYTAPASPKSSIPPTSPITRRVPVPVVEIRSPAHPRTRAGPSRIRANASSDVASSSHPRPSASVLKAGPSARAKRPSVVPTFTLPSYSILFHQEQEVKPPSKKPYPLLRPDLKFDGVYVPAPPRWKGKAREAGGQETEAVREDGDVNRRTGENSNEAGPEGIANSVKKRRRNEDESEDAYMAMAESSVVRTTNGVSTTTSTTKRLDAVVVTSSVRVVKSQRRHQSSPRHVMDEDE